ncbi:hypothetical protein ACVNPS_04635 [Candidatus Bipolaricaulota sp. J31]
MHHRIGPFGLAAGFFLFLAAMGSGVEADVFDMLDVLLYPPGVAAIYPGELAPEWPADVPLPADAVLAGSVVLNDDSVVAAFSTPVP